MCAEQGERRPVRNLREGGDSREVSGWDLGAGKVAFSPVPLGEQTHCEND